MSRKQVSRSTNQGPFAIDTFRDVLTAVVGAPADDSLGKRIIGRDSIVLAQAVEVSELASVATRLLDLYGLDDYKTQFGREYESRGVVGFRGAVRSTTW